MRGSAILLIALLIALFSLVCETDADRIREANEAARQSQGSSPPAGTPPTPEPTSTPKPISTVMTTTIDVIEVREGDCLRFFGEPDFGETVEISDLELVECSGMWEARVLHSFVIDLAFLDDLEMSFPGDIYFLGQGVERCDRRSTLYLFPNFEAWARGDRTFDCLQERFGQAEPSENVVNTMTLNSGECYNYLPLSDGTAAELVPCNSANWTWRVLNTFDVSVNGPYPDLTYLDEQANGRCDARMDFYMYPTPETWEAGDREILCLDEQQR